MSFLSTVKKYVAENALNEVSRRILKFSQGIYIYVFMYLFLKTYICNILYQI